MRWRAWILALVAIGGLACGGCGEVDNTPPADATTETPVLDIDEGVTVPADELDKSQDAGAETDATGPAGDGQ